MKLATALSLMGLGLGIAGFVSAQGCSSSDSSGGGGSTAAGKQPPPKPDAPATTATDDRTFAVNALYLGEADRSGAASKDAWKNYGYNLDGKITDKTSTDVCTRPAGASASNQEDGNEGIDNSFGKVIIPFLAPFAAAPSKQLTDAITSGSFSILLTIKGLTDDAKQTNTGLSGDLRVGAKFSDTATPTFTPSDDWPYRANPIVPITGAYINQGTFVNGSEGAQVQLSLFIQGVSLDLTINKAIITFDHSAPNDITNGTIAGVIETEALVSGIEKVAGRISTQLCSGSTLDTIKSSLRQASDILKDGSNKAGVPCDGISIGIGFTGKRIGPPKTVAQESAAPPDPCTSSGQDAGTDSGNNQQQDAGQDAADQ